MVASSEKTPAPHPRRKSVAENVKETLESIVIAFILAFVFRAFIVEAFVIPTGSMAVTLYGDQLTNTCSTCGYEYALGVTAPMQASPQPAELRCPNCDMKFDKFKALQTARPDSGDRILVHKWPFDIGGALLGPHRWDVVVFKDPRDGTTNFIKRLIGLPGEVLEIIDGDIYRVPIKKLQDKRPELLREINDLRKLVHRCRTAPDEALRQSILKRYQAVNRGLLPLLEIDRKTARAQASLWFNVYHHDFLPSTAGGAASRSPRVGWEPVDAQGGGWDTSTREIRFEGESDQRQAIHFVGKAIDDFHAYNNDGVRNPVGAGPRHPVGDLRLRFTWVPLGGRGGLVLEINRDWDRFIAELRMDGKVRMDHVEVDPPGSPRLPAGRQTIGAKELAAFVPGRAVPVEFINVDYRVSLVVDGEEVVASTDGQYSPRAKLSRLAAAGLGTPGADDVRVPEARIAGWNLSCRLRHLVLERDVYYRSPKLSDEQDTQPNPYDGWPGWGTEGQPILLRDQPVPGDATLEEGFSGEYFMLGDNSPQSKDSRLWWEIGDHLRYLGDDYQVGTVRGDQLIGKAFFVYWPAGYRPAWAAGIGLIPNFGQMRWIR